MLTKPRPAEAMIARVLESGIQAGWVAADSAYGRDGKFRTFLQAHRMPYVVEVPVKQTVADTNGRCRVDTLIGRAPVDAWHRVSAGAGVRGERVYDWAWATLPAVEEAPAGFVRTLVARRWVDDPTDIVYSTPLNGRRSYGWPGLGGRSRSASRRPRTRPAWTTTRFASGSRGIGTSPWPWLRTPSWP